jgi:uncharacterized protein YprB with RNaseH-like and TPR domain/predicted nuclease with RNAse H fold/cytidylate kinase
MLRSTFRHVPGIGAKTERRLWESGVATWEDALSDRARYHLGDNAVRTLQASIGAFRAGDAEWFAAQLPRQEYWRIALDFPRSSLFVDIETTGLSRHYHEITVIGWVLDGCYDAVILGEDHGRFLAAVRHAKVLITFNGSLFDCPFLRAAIPEIALPIAHVDLRYACRRIGLTGGQKAVESLVGLSRPRTLDGVDGAVAPDLWRLYQRGSVKSLRTLLAYNAADVQGMQKILQFVSGRLIAESGLPRQVRPHLPRSDRRSFPPGLSTRQKTASAWRGDVGPKLRHSDVAGRRKNEVVVGIDLSGSSRRASGWAALRGPAAEAKLLWSDEEILTETVRARPAIVAIDAPLSLPAGRISVYDDDPTREAYGIMRTCERTLRSRGINAYPALIKSMQELTRRGMELAASLRLRGIPVIECFPGAMQDILGIPRKRNSMFWLERGLQEYGLVGDAFGEGLSHDELDALSAAVVGQLALGGRVELLGNESEGYLAVPELQRMQGSTVVIGLSGSTGAGKSVLATELARLPQFELISTSRIVASLTGGAAQRSKLQRLGEMLHESGRQVVLLDEVAARVSLLRRNVVDAMRFPEDRAFLGERYRRGFVHIHIHARAEDRRSRFLQRGGSASEFVDAEDSSVEASVAQFEELAHLTLVNDHGSPDAFSTWAAECVMEYLKVNGVNECPSP